MIKGKRKPGGIQPKNPQPAYRWRRYQHTMDLGLTEFCGGMNLMDRLCERSEAIQGP